MVHNGNDETVTEIGRNLLPIALAIGTVIAALGPVLELFGVKLPDVLAEYVTKLLAALIMLGGLIYTRLKTTPLVDPRANDGTPLVKAPTTNRGYPGSPLG